MSAVPQSRTATEAEAGRACPYCRFPLKDGIEVVECGSCASVHHGDCWGDNRGCAIVGCESGPTGARTGVAPTPPPAPRASAPSSAPMGVSPLPAPALPPQQPVSRGPWLIAAVIILALAIAGAAAAYVITQKKDKTTAAQVSAPARTPTNVAPPEPDPSSQAGAQPNAEPPSGVLPDESRSQMKADIESLLLDWHTDIVNGDYRSAWNLLTPRKRAQKLREDGYAKWSHDQVSLGNNLDPSGVRVSIMKADEATGVVTVNVHGMRLINPTRNCTYWSGVTWVKYENGEWLYEPGFSTTRARRAYWEKRAGQTLGWGCT